MPTPMRLRSRALPDIKLENSSEGEQEHEQLAIPPARVNRAAEGRAVALAGTTSQDKETLGLISRRPSKRRLAGKTEPVRSRPQAKMGIPGGWTPVNSRPPKNVSLAIAAVVSVLFLLLVVFRPLKTGRPPPSTPAAPAAAPPAPFPLADEPIHPSHAELAAQGLHDYTYEKIISHRISLGLPHLAEGGVTDDGRPASRPRFGGGGSPADPSAAAGAGSVEGDPTATERKLREIAVRYGIPFEDLVRDMAELGRAAVAG